MKQKLKIRYFILGILLVFVWLTQLIPALSETYARSIYPIISIGLSKFSGLFAFAVGDLFIFLSIAGIIIYPIYGRIKKKTWKNILLKDGEYLLWIYVWFYLAWGLNYSQADFYKRTNIPYTAYTHENFNAFADTYIELLNESYVSITDINKKLIGEETIKGYQSISDSLGVNTPLDNSPKAKTMLFTPLISMVGVSGSMGPFFCEFTLNGDLLPWDYPSTYAHEFAHFLGITSEAEANFYAYQVCTRTDVKAIRFSGYFSILRHVLANARRLMAEEEYTKLWRSIRPEVIRQMHYNQIYWMTLYNPIIGDAQDWIYDLYLKGNRIKSGKKNYSEVIGLLISNEEWKKKSR